MCLVWQLLLDELQLANCTKCSTTVTTADDGVHQHLRPFNMQYDVQAIGWHTHKSLANDHDARFPLSQTDVTQKEGRSVADYFGFLA